MTAGQTIHRAALTLFEIAVSLAVLATAVIAAALLFPVGLRAQHLARSQALACVTTLNVLDAWGQGEHDWWDRQVEAEQVGQETFNRGVVPDLDRVLALRDFELVPLPDDIGRRLDSDGDEIARLLDAGGRLFYPRTFTTQDVQFRLTQVMTADDDARRLVFGVVGAAQHNALLNHPCLAWPYYDWYPMAPEAWERDSWHVNPSWPAQAEFDALYAAYNAEAQPTTTPPASYLPLAQALAAAAGVATTATPAGPVPDPPPPLPAAPWSASDDGVFPPPWRIWAIAHLAHAAAAATADPAHTIAQEEYAQRCHESCLAWAMRYASTSPYDWGAPRPLNRQTAWDYPLLEWDLFPSASFPEIALADGTGDVSWRVIGRDEPRNFGQARGCYGFDAMIPPNHDRIAASWGDRAHFDLCRPFAAAERMRELVCWSANWQAFEDFEEVPAATPDSGRAFLDSRGKEVVTEATWGNDNPERPFFWSDATRTATAPLPSYAEASSWRPAVETAAYKAVWMGLWGADRDGDGRLTHGPLPRAARLRAVTVSRVPVYDRRMVASFRE